MTYTQLAVFAAAAAVLLDTVLLRTRLLRCRLYWTAYAIVLAFQLLTNGILAGRGIVTYDPHTILGPRLAYAPVEDLLFGFAMVTLTLCTWVRLGHGADGRPRAGRRAGWPPRWRPGWRPRWRPRRRAAVARARPGTATASLRVRPTDTRRSSTR
jgi:lycopene cyclase domain-containing protein